MSLVAELQRRNVLRVALAYLAASWLAIQVVETIFPLFGLSDSAARLVVILLAIGFIPALVASWFFELTPEGFKRDSEVERSVSARHVTGRRLDRLIIVVLVLALVYFAVDKFVLSQARVESAREQGRTQGLIEAYGDRSIAVLPFADMSAARDQGFMSDGIAEELLNLLAKVPELRVISRSSAFSFRGSNLDIPSIAEQLNVSYVLEGSVRTAGNRIRVTSQLIDARSDTHVWSETYERELDDIFAIQDDIANTVVGSLKLTLLEGGLSVATADPEAYAHFLQGRYLHENPTTGGLEKALAEYKAAVAIDENYAPAWVWLAAVYDDLEETSENSYEEVGVLAKAAVNRALEIDPDYALALGMRAIVTREWDNDLVKGAADMQRALDLDPLNPILLRWTALYLLGLSRYDDAVRVNEYLLQRDPIGWITRFNLAGSYQSAGRFEDAVRICETLLAVKPDAGRTRLTIALANLMLGNAAAAMEHAELQSRPVRQELVTAMAAHRLGDQARYQQAVDALLGRYEAGDLTVSYSVAMVFAYVGETDSAFEWLERSLVDNTFYLVPDDSMFPALHDDPRWDALMRRGGISAERLRAIELEIRLPSE